MQFQHSPQVPGKEKNSRRLWDSKHNRRRDDSESDAPGVARRQDCASDCSLYLLESVTFFALSNYLCGLASDWRSKAKENHGLMLLSAGPGSWH